TRPRDRQLAPLPASLAAPLQSSSLAARRTGCRVRSREGDKADEALDEPRKKYLRIWLHRRAFRSPIPQDGTSHEGHSSCETIIAPKGVYLKGDYRRQVTEIIQSLCFSAVDQQFRKMCLGRTAMKMVKEIA